MSQSGAENIRNKVLTIVSEKLGIDKDEISEKSSFVSDLGADSLDQVEMIMQFEEEFGIEISDEMAEKMTTVGDVIQYVDENS